MTSAIAGDLTLLLDCAELAELQSALSEESHVTLNQLKMLSSCEELDRLDDKNLSIGHGHTFLGLLEEFGKINRSDELLHSRFWRFFLNPVEKKNRLGSELLSKILKEAQFYGQGTPLMPFDVDTEISSTEVRLEVPSEQGRLDIRLRNPTRKLTMIIENKRNSGESERQLAKYWEDAEKADRDFAIAGLFSLLPTEEHQKLREVQIQVNRLR